MSQLNKLGPAIVTILVLVVVGFAIHIVIGIIKGDSNNPIIPAEPEEKLQVCPDEWIDNQMPGTFEQRDHQRQYYILDGKRREISEFDSDWVSKNCNLEKQIVY